MFKKNLLSESSNISTEKKKKPNSANTLPERNPHTPFSNEQHNPLLSPAPSNFTSGRGASKRWVFFGCWVDFQAGNPGFFSLGGFGFLGGRKNIRKTHNRLKHHKQAWLKINSLHQSSRKSMQIVSVPAFSATSTRVFSSAGGKEKTFPKEMRSVAPLWCCLRQGSIFLRSSISVHSVLPSSYFLRQKIGSFWRWRISC